MRNPFAKGELRVPVAFSDKWDAVYDKAHPEKLGRLVARCSLDEARYLLEILGNPENRASELGDAQIKAREWVRAFDA